MLQTDGRTGTSILVGHTREAVRVKLLQIIVNAWVYLVGQDGDEGVLGDLDPMVQLDAVGRNESSVV